MIRAAALAVLLISATSAFAKQDDINKIALAEGDFAAQRAQIEADLADGKTYAEISRNDRAKVRESLDRIGATLAGVESIDALNPDAKARVFNDQELVNAILERRDVRTICSNEVATGSLVRVTKCATYAHESGGRDASLRD